MNIKALRFMVASNVIILTITIIKVIIITTITVTINKMAAKASLLLSSTPIN